MVIRKPGNTSKNSEMVYYELFQIESSFTNGTVIHRKKKLLKLSG